MVVLLVGGWLRKRANQESREHRHAHAGKQRVMATTAAIAVAAAAVAAQQDQIKTMAECEGAIQKESASVRASE